MSNLIHITTCTLCDPKAVFQLEEPGFEIEDLSQGTVPERLAQFQMKLLGHVQKAASWEQGVLQKALKRHHEGKGPQPDIAQAKHFKAWTEFMSRTAAAQGTAIMQCYHTTDPGLNMMHQIARLRLNTVTRKWYYTDDMLLDAVVQLGLDDEDQARVLTLVKAIRDTLCEQGEFTPQNEQKRLQAV